MKFSEAINEALIQAMEIDPKVLCYGLGVDDPKRIFGTTNDLVEKFGKERVFDMPISENAMTGVGVGAALGGYKPVFVHQRLDFFLLAMDQLVNSAAKWHFMFGGQNSVPMVIRLIMGRGWGQGPTHSQTLHSWFSHIPGLKVVMPSSPADAKGLLMSSIFDKNPVVFLEHRWLHNMEGDVPEGDYRVSLDKVGLVREGEDVTIVATSAMVSEAIHGARHLEEQGIDCEILDLRTIRPMDIESILTSVRKTGRLIAMDIGTSSGSIAGDVIAKVSENAFSDLKCAPKKICFPDHAAPTSFGMTDGLYPGASDVISAVEVMMSKDLKCQEIRDKATWPHDVPGTWFNGPF